MQIIVARELLKFVQIGEKQVRYLVEQARRGAVEGHRGEIFAVRSSKICTPLRLVAAHCFTFWHVSTLSQVPMPLPIPLLIPRHFRTKSLQALMLGDIQRPADQAGRLGRAYSFS